MFQQNEVPVSELPNFHPLSEDEESDVWVATESAKMVERGGDWVDPYHESLARALRLTLREIERLKHKCGEDRPDLDDLARAWVAHDPEALRRMHDDFPNYPGDDWFGNGSSLATAIMTVRYG